jgi:hypothetical protein
MSDCDSMLKMRGDGIIKLLIPMVRRRAKHLRLRQAGF